MTAYEKAEELGFIEATKEILRIQESMKSSDVNIRPSSSAESILLRTDDQNLITKLPAIEINLKTRTIKVGSVEIGMLP